jgi:3-oxoacyl-[acyl-carrier-protein] synthase II
LPEIDPARRAVITGLGAVMPIGNDFPTYWANLVAGVTGTRLIQGFDATGFEVRIAAEVLDFDPAAAMDPKMARRMTRFIHFAMAAGKEAVADSGIDFAAMTQDERDRVGVVVNTGGGGIEAIIDGTHVHDTKGPRFVSPFAVPALSGSMGAALLSIEYGLTGPVMTQVAACATSVIAFHRRASYRTGATRSPASRCASRGPSCWPGQQRPSARSGLPSRRSRPRRTRPIG